MSKGGRRISKLRPAVLKKASRSKTLADAKTILPVIGAGAPSFVRRASGDELAMTFKPFVERGTARAKLATCYDRYASEAAEPGLRSVTDANTHDYATATALAGLFNSYG